jgi:Zinc dependent phospholipase C
MSKCFQQKRTHAGRSKGGDRAVISLATLVCLLVAAPLLQGYSILSHEALIDAAWKPSIVPLLLSRYPNATPSQIRMARAYAYGGCVIQDLGYYPLGNHFFSNLTHYVRTGDFVEALLRDSRNINEYAFALGALSHYVADDTGHPLAVNLSVPKMYPKLRSKYGNRVTYEDNPRAHIMTEFSFDVVQVTGAGYLPRTYHNFVGFQVPESLLNRAFEDTYGLKLSGLFWFEGLSLAIYKLSASEIIPDLGQALWRHERKRLYRVNPRIVTARFSYRLSPENYEKSSTGTRRARRFKPWTWHWKATAARANARLISRFLVVLIEILPKVGSLQTLRFRPPTVPVQDLFIKAFDVTVARYESDVARLRKRNLVLPEKNLDTGNLLVAGQYFLADDTYARLLNDQAKHRFRSMTPQLRQNILAFYGNLNAPIATKDHPRKWRKTLRELAALRSAPIRSEMASR